VQGLKILCNTDGKYHTCVWQDDAGEWMTRMAESCGGRGRELKATKDLGIDVQKKVKKDKKQKEAKKEKA
jgi:hypothetical protein